jgi:hypothetical protein
MGSLLPGLPGIGGGGSASNSGGSNSGGLLGGNFNPSDTSNTLNRNEQTDSRRVNTSSGSGLSAIDGSTLNFSMVDPGAFDLAGKSVDSSIGLAKQIASTLGASLGQYSVGATNSVDGFTHLLDGQQQAISAVGDNNAKLTMMALAVGGLVAIMALRRGK